MTRVIKVNETLKGKRADLVAVEALPQLSRAYIHKLFDQAQITLADESLKPGYRLKTGDKLIIHFEPSQLEVIPDIDLPILYEDEDVLVVNKPAGVISHARGRFWNEPSVASFVRQKTGQEGERAGIVHRLDRATSGVMICAKNAVALSHLQKQFSSRKVKKTYVAIIGGHLTEEEAIIDMPIGRHPAKPQTFRATADGKPARTQYRVTKRLKHHDVLELVPETGRTHQLRVHLQQVGHPIIGDTLYGGQPADRLYLHAYSLMIALPNGQKQQFVSPLPASFKKFEAEHA